MPHDVARPLMPSSEATDYYSISRLRWNTLVFTGGKVVNATLSLLLFALIASKLSKTDFATYAWLLAFIELATNISRFGINWVVDRYVPQLRSTDNAFELRRFLLIMTGLRFVLILILAFAFYVAGQTLLDRAGNGDWLPAFDSYIVILIPFAMMTFVRDNVFQSLLQQSHSQANTTIRHVTFFAILLGIVYVSDELTLTHVIYGDIAATVIAVLIGLGQLGHLLRKLPYDAEPRSKAMPRWSAIAQFAANSYADDLLRMSGSGQSVMMAAPYLFAAATVASFGFCLTLFLQLNRFLPAHLFSGLYRPRFVAEYTKSGSFAVLNRQLIIILKISNYIIAAGIAVFAVYGDVALGLVSQGKYADAYGLMLLFLALMLVDNQRQVLMVLCNVIEKVSFLSRSSLMMPLAVPLAIALAFTGLGSYGLALSLVIADLLSIGVVIWLLRRAGFPLTFDLPRQLLILAAALLSIIAGFAFHSVHPDSFFWNLAGMAFVGLTFTATARLLGPIDEDERASIDRLVGRKIHVL